ncbi:translation initiation factor IF-3 [Clostridium perfringens]|nr:translation initiation factor IF-3 [Clostridium perfringens]HAT4313626.1 translation initiation factor IF-3 [Clostridium perfringens]
MNKISKNFAINQEIREKEVRLISSTGEQLGVVSGRDAQKMADEAELDLVMISPNAKPPVCKIMDYGKFIYEQSKKEKEAKKKQKVISVKEIRVSPTIEKHDLEIKAKNAKKFLEAGDKVKITVRFRGREAEHSHVGIKILDSFLAQLEEVCSVEKPAKLEGRNMIMILAPKKA